MKVKLTVMTCLILMAGLTTFAQQQRRTVEERVNEVIEKIKVPLNLRDEQVGKLDSVFTNFYQSQRKLMSDIRASGERPDRSVFEKLTTERDDKLKAILDADQYKKFKDELEPAMRPQRRNQGN